MTLLAPLHLPDWPTDTLETALAFQQAGRPAPFVAECRQRCGGRARCGGVCADCLKKELSRRTAAVETVKA